MAVEILLSNSYLQGTTPARLRCSMRESYALVISVSVHFLIGLTRMALPSMFTITMMYLFPAVELVRNWPVWSMDMVSLLS